MRILVVRPDRLGDVILSTPVFEAIKQHYKKSRLTVMVQEPVGPLLKGLSSVDHLFFYEPKAKHSGFKGFFRLYSEIRRRKYHVAIVLQSDWKIAAALFLAQVRYRVGPLSKLHSFFFYNRGTRQRRSHVEMHETDYNLQLLRRLGIRVGTGQIPTRISIPLVSHEKAQEWLEKRGWKPSQPLVLVHPGMGGSALNWPESHYQDLVRNLVQENLQILVTGGPGEKQLLAQLGQALGSLKEKVMFYGENESYPVDFLAGLMSFASVVVAPSTGPLHVAVALGKPVVTFYPPIRVQSAIRWGPYIPDESRASVFVPEVYCGQDFKCLGNLCNYFPCMKSLTVKQAVEQTLHHLVRVRESK